MKKLLPLLFLITTPFGSCSKVKADIKQDIDSIFKEKKPKIGLATQPFKGGQGGIGQFADPTKTFVEYTDL